MLEIHKLCPATMRANGESFQKSYVDIPVREETFTPRWRSYTLLPFLRWTEIAAMAPRWFYHDCLEYRTCGTFRDTLLQDFTVVVNSTKWHFTARESKSRNYRENDVSLGVNEESSFHLFSFNNLFLFHCSTVMRRDFSFTFEGKRRLSKWKKKKYCIYSHTFYFNGIIVNIQWISKSLWTYFQISFSRICSMLRLQR